VDIDDPPWLLLLVGGLYEDCSSLPTYRVIAIPAQARFAKKKRVKEEVPPEDGLANYL
jgi:hypothetical protein